MDAASKRCPVEAIAPRNGVRYNLGSANRAGRGDMGEVFLPRRGGIPACLLSILLLLAGDIERNPGPTFCSVCRGVVRGASIFCNQCDGWVHRRCTGLTGKEYLQECNANRRGGGRAYVCPKHQAAGVDADSGGRRPGLRLFQWNAGGLSANKLGELRRFLERAAPPVDVLAIQETHLQPERSLKLPGYEVVRADRVRGRRADARVAGGGLLTAVRSGITYGQRSLTVHDSATEVLAVDIFGRNGRRPALRVVNLYAPPIVQSDEDDRPTSLGLDFVPTDDRTIICGDVNAHHPTWDSHQPANSSGQALDEWALDHGLVSLNTGDATRVNPASGGLSAPDVTLAQVGLERRCYWNVHDDSMGSDHLPIEVCVGGCRIRTNRQRRVQPRPSWKAADWETFGNVLDKELRAHPGPFDCAASASAAFVAALNLAVSRSVPSSVRPHPKWWWSSECTQAVEERRRRRRIAVRSRDPTDLDRWREARRHACKTIALARQSAWRAYASNLNMRSDPSAVWRTIRSLDGRADVGSNHVTMKRGPKECVSSKEKAKSFIDTYAAVSRVPHDAEDRGLRRAVYARLREPCGCRNRRPGFCCPFSNAELESALRKLKPGKAAGPDGIATEPLRHLTELARTRLLDVANLSWTRGEVPPKWRLSTIVPVPKPGKPTDKVESFRPVSLTSNVCKVVERMVAARLSDLLERNGALARVQAGFRAGRSAEDQVLRLVESICARFEEKEKRTVLALVDFSRAFDKVWHIGLLHKLFHAGVPTCCVRWIRQFLSDRRASVRLNGECSKQRIFRAGVPQGAVLSPLLFLVYIDDLARVLPGGVDVSLYADDVAIWTGARTIADASERTQSALQELESWARRWKLVISAEKSESAASALGNNAESLAVPSLQLGGFQLHCNESPTLLGVTLDRRMTFRVQVQRVADRMTYRLQQLRRLAGRTWGCCARDLRTVYVSYIRAVADYCGACFLTGAAESTIRQLEVIQRKAARIITGCVASTPVSALEREAQLMPLRLRGQQLAACALIRAATRPDDDPLRLLIAARQHVSKRLKVERSWLPLTMADVSERGLRLRDVRGRDGILPTPPWQPWPCFDVRTELAFEPIDDSQAALREAAERTLAGLPCADAVVWTDGSVSGNQTNGGGAFVIEWSGGEVSTGCRAAGRFASSYDAELTAILAACRHLLRHLPRTNPDRQAEIRLCTDSRSALQAIRAGPSSCSDGLFAGVWWSLSALSRRHRLTLQWVPAHCGIAGNEAADALAATAASLQQHRTPITYDAALSFVRRVVRLRWLEGPQPQWHRSLAGPLPELLDLPRTDAVTVAQLRTGHCPLLASYMYRIGVAETPDCPDCGDEEDTAAHLLMECPAHHTLRRALFGASPLLDYSSLTTSYAAVAVFIRRSGRTRPLV